MRKALAIAACSSAMLLICVGTLKADWASSIARGATRGVTRDIQRNMQERTLEHIEKNQQNDQSQEKSFSGYKCERDCSGHIAGFNWALSNDIARTQRCTGNNISFIEGCHAFVKLQKAYREKVIKATIIFKESGIRGLELLSRECRRQNGTAETLCIYFDTVGAYIDAKVSDTLGFPPDEYFSQEQSLSRWAPALNSMGLKLSKSNAYLRGVHRYVSRIVDTELGW